MGTAELSCASLQTLARDKQFQIVAVVTQPDKPKGRDLKLQPSPVKSLAQKLNLPVLQPLKARDEQFIVGLRDLKPDLIVVVAYGQILPQGILDLPRFGCVNVHTSLLPKYRGAAPIQWAIADGEPETGVTIMKNGCRTRHWPGSLHTPHADSAKRTIRKSCTTVLRNSARNCLSKRFPNYVTGKIQPQAQPAEGASYAAKIKKEDGRIDWNQPAHVIWNHLRAFTPWPGAFTLFAN